MEYIRSAKGLNWSLFFDRFNFTLSYRPGSCNVKPDALSRQFPACPDETVEPSTLNQPAPSPCPPDRLLVPAPLRSDVLQWGHASRLTCHPGIQLPQDFLQRRFWWSSLGEDVRGFVNACPVCNRKDLAAHKPASCIHCPSPIVPGRISPWTL